MTSWVHERQVPLMCLQNETVLPSRLRSAVIFPTARLLLKKGNLKDYFIDLWNKLLRQVIKKQHK